MRIAISGASGLLGGNLAYLGAQAGHEVLAAYNAHEVKVPGCRMRSLDLLKGDITSELDAHRPECVVHAAAWADVDGCERDQALAHALNVEATRRVADYCQKRGLRLIFISTDSVFDGKKAMHTEEEKPAPLNYYAQTKAEAEDIVRALPSHAVVRTNFYGFNLRKKNSFSEWLQAKLGAGEPITGFTDFYFSPLPANNLAGALLELAGLDWSGTLHVAGDGRLNKYEFALKFADIMGLDRGLISPGKMSDNPALAAPRPSDCSLDITKAKKMIKSRLPGIEEGIQTYKTLLESGYAQKMRAGT